ncbi:hypothetical protein [Marinobacterium rhizophilum]|uniref:DUF1835 domain-containing protein n=1 Tax=Marinobacterium rhizophilum TaxID=420402 RepID=A0ABY5HL23_9GAMM|nr:hypothetical protein [Marinobacterium rhizophilum]UTW12659.1 hypothetical protein KDW95_02965 [Marinobacterium rhizophilum]
MLHITHGDMANQWLQQAGIDGEYLAWSDVLHEGPVPAGLGLDELSRVRAAFIASCGWATDFEAQTHFQARDALFRRAAREGGVVIWNSFELYDQLHLLQLLNWYHEEGQGLAWPELVLVADYLGQADSTQAAGLFARRLQVSEAQLALAVDAWQAFCSPNPRMLVNLLQRDLSALPFLESALVRVLQEYPDPAGVNRTERAVLQAVESGVRAPAELFKAVRAREEVAFMGDASFWRVLDGLLRGPCALLDADGRFVRPGLGGCDDAFLGLGLSLTPLGLQVLNGASDWLSQQPIDRWIGGVNLSGSGIWRWDSTAGTLQRGP